MLKLNKARLLELENGLMCAYNEGMISDEEENFQLTKEIRGFIELIEKNGKGFIVVAFVDAEMTELK